MRTFILFILAILLFSCGPNPTKIAKQKYEKAVELSNLNQQNEAKALLDTIIEQYTTEVEYYTRAKDLLRSIQIKELEHNLLFLDSVLLQKTDELNILMKNFIISDEYGTEKKLIHKRQQPKNSYNRSYLQVNLNTKGQFYISSRYTGEYWLYHNQIKVYHNNQSVKSDIIKEDGFLNRRFDDGNNKWETVKYKNGSDNGIIDFVAENWKKPLKVQFIGKKHHYIVMEKFDKEAIRDGYEISFVLKDIEKIKTEISSTKNALSQLK